MCKEPWKILIVDDEPDVHSVTTMTLRRMTYEERPLEFYSAYSAKEALEVLKVETDIAVAVVDVVMENDSAGLDLVGEIRSTLDNQDIRLILRTGNPGHAPEDEVIMGYDINDYRLKTEVSAQSLKTSIVTALRSYKALTTIKGLNIEIEANQKELLYTLGEIAESRSHETGNHIERVSKITGVLASKLNYSKNEVDLLKLAASMHDIGKIAIDDRILNKPGKLDVDEFDKMKKHSAYGYEILRNSDRILFKLAAEIAHEHHENFDGSGYPRGLKGKEITKHSRIVALVDVYDALSIKRVYKEAWPKEEVYAFIKSQVGKKFDPEIVEVFFQNIDEIEEIVSQLQ